VYLLNYLKGKINESKLDLPYPLIVFESDDWGTIRMPSLGIKNQLESEHSGFVSDPYLQYDCLETDADLEILFDLLAKHKDADGKPCILTANCISQNPDFESIKGNGFQQWVGQDFRETLKNNEGSGNAYLLQLKAMEAGLFHPQFHGREHIQIFRWMDALKNGNNLLRRAFDLNMISFKTPGSPPCIMYYMDAMHPETNAMLNNVVEVIADGLKLFKSAWGFNSSTLIAPCYFWHSKMENKLMPFGIRGFQGIRIQKESNLNGNPYSFKKRFHYPGEINKSGQHYFVRNAYFEPSLDEKRDWVDSCLAEVKQSILRYGFATVSIHRLNFMGAINIQNRERNIRLFDLLLKKLLSTFPSLRFASTADLLNHYSLKQ
jgi:hypothetical protein